MRSEEYFEPMVLEQVDIQRQKNEAGQQAALEQVTCHGQRRPRDPGPGGAGVT